MGYYPPETRSTEWHTTEVMSYRERLNLAGIQKLEDILLDCLRSTALSPSRSGRSALRLGSFEYV